MKFKFCVSILLLTLCFSAMGLANAEVIDPVNEADLHDYQVPIYLQVVGKTGEKIPAYAQPTESSSILGYYLAGTCLELIEEYSDFYHVRMGISGEVGTESYIRSEHIQRINRRFTDFTGIEAIGFVEMYAREHESVSTRSFPDMSSPRLEEYLYPEAYPITGETYDLIADLGEWCQVRYYTDHDLGFIPKTNVDVHVFADLVIQEDIVISEPGTYSVGADMPAGLYTLLPLENETVEIIVSGSDTRHDQRYSVIGPSHYTIYIPTLSTVTKYGDAIMRNTNNEYVITRDNASYEGSGRFFMGVDMDPCVSHYTITPTYEAGDAYVIQSSFSGYPALGAPDYENGENLYASKYSVTDEVDVRTRTGTFIEIYKCNAMAYYDDMFSYGFPLD